MGQRDKTSLRCYSYYLAKSDFSDLSLKERFILLAKLAALKRRARSTVNVNPFSKEVWHRICNLYLSVGSWIQEVGKPVDSRYPAQLKLWTKRLFQCKLLCRSF